MLALSSACSVSTEQESSSGAGSCVRTEERAQIAVERAGQPRLDCASVSFPFDPVPATVLEGSVVRSGADFFEIDTCAPNADCVSSIARFEGKGPGLELWLPAGDFVRVTYVITRFHSCQQSLEVSTIASWAGLPNPAGRTGALLLAVSDGGFTFDDSPYSIDRVALGCLPATRGCGGPTPDEYALVLTPKAAPERAIRLGMGQSASISLLPAPATGAWSAHNLRSYQTEICDDYWNFAWFIMWRPPPT